MPISHFSRLPSLPFRKRLLAARCYTWSVWLCLDSVAGSGIHYRAHRRYFILRSIPPSRELPTLRFKSTSRQYSILHLISIMSAPTISIGVHSFQTKADTVYTIETANDGTTIVRESPVGAPPLSLPSRTFQGSCTIDGSAVQQPSYTFTTKSDGTLKGIE